VNAIRDFEKYLSKDERAKLEQQKLKEEQR